MIAKPSLQGLVKFGAPCVNGSFGSAGLVAQIVAIAHERVDGAHRLSLLLGKEHERVIEVLGARASHFQAILIRLFDRDHYAARAKAMRANEPSSRRARSILDITGRAPSTS